MQYNFRRVVKFPSIQAATGMHGHNKMRTCATADFRFLLDFLPPPDVTAVVDGPAGDIPESPSEQEEDDELGRWSGLACCSMRWYP